MREFIHSSYLGDGRLSILRGMAVGLLAVHEGELAYDNWLYELDANGHLDGDPNEPLLINQFWWCGDYSGACLDILTKTILPETTGSAQILLIDDDGALEGIEVNDGVVTEKPVRVTLE